MPPLFDGVYKYGTFSVVVRRGENLRPYPARKRPETGRENRRIAREPFTRVTRYVTRFDNIFVYIIPSVTIYHTDICMYVCKYTYISSFGIVLFPATTHVSHEPERASCRASTAGCIGLPDGPAHLASGAARRNRCEFRISSGALRGTRGRNRGVVLYAAYTRSLVVP